MPLKDLLPSEQAKQGDRVLRVATELLEQSKRFTDRDSYIMARGLLTRWVSCLFPAELIGI
jgi:hypothetical protein